MTGGTWEGGVTCLSVGEGLGGIQEVCYLPGEDSQGAFPSEKVRGWEEGVCLAHNGRGWGQGGVQKLQVLPLWHPSPSRAALTLPVLSGLHWPVEEVRPPEIRTGSGQCTIHPSS